MPIRVSDLGGKLRHLAVKWEGEVVNITYSPSANSLADSMALQEDLEGSSARQYKALVDRLCHVMVGWDVLEDPSPDGRGAGTNGEDTSDVSASKPDKPLPITEENLMQLPEEFVSAIFRAIRESQEPNPPRSRR